MYFYAEGVELDYESAHIWFHEAAEQGNALAQRNLGLFHSQVSLRIPPEYFDPTEANLWFSLYSASAEGGSSLAAQSYSAFLGSKSRPNTENVISLDASGERIYLAACAGCHGFDGQSSYPRAPSLISTETQAKSESELLQTVLDGRNTMPAWRETLTEDQARSVLAYLRSRAANQSKENHFDGQQQRSGDLPPRDEAPEHLYTRFCGGCHGFNGISYYVNSPSFALGQRLEKSDQELARSIARGKGVMPSWENMLTEQQIRLLVGHIRTLADAYRAGIDRELLMTPDHYFLFAPLGESGDEWHVRGEQ
jgi:mono/diheme cytochrome c family protein